MIITLLLLPGLIANGWPEMHPFSVGQGAPQGTHQDPQATLLQYVDVVVVGIPHGPAGGVPLGLLVVGSVDEPAVTVGPFGEGVVLIDTRNGTVVDVPVCAA